MSGWMSLKQEHQERGASSFLYRPVAEKMDGVE